MPLESFHTHGGLNRIEFSGMMGPREHNFLTQYVLPDVTLPTGFSAIDLNAVISDIHDASKNPSEVIPVITALMQTFLAMMTELPPGMAQVTQSLILNPMTVSPQGQPYGGTFMFSIGLELLSEFKEAMRASGYSDEDIEHHSARGEEHRNSLRNFAPKPKEKK